MKRFPVGLVVALCTVLAGASVSGRQSKPAAPVLVVDTVKGVIEITLDPAGAPKSVEHVLDLVNRRFYRGIRFHWVQPGVVQFGDPMTRDMTKQDSWGMGGSGRPVGVAEPSKQAFVRGSVGLAFRPTQKATDADSQIFILRYPNPGLNGKYAQIGRVTKGLDVLDKIAAADMIRTIQVKQ
jgi:peptidylprolyl isomerase